MKATASSNDRNQLGRHSGRWLGVAGAAEMRDGKVALLLDLAALTAQNVVTEWSERLSVKDLKPDTTLTPN